MSGFSVHGLSAQMGRRLVRVVAVGLCSCLASSTFGRTLDAPSSASFVWGSLIEPGLSQPEVEILPPLVPEKLKSANLQALMIQLNWRKLEPEPGMFSSSELDRLRTLFATLREAGIQPIPVLHNPALGADEDPLWFRERGSWLSPESPRRFFEYARQMQQTLGPFTDAWITFEGPMVRALEVILSANTEERTQQILGDAFEVTAQLARAHRASASFLRIKTDSQPNPYPRAAIRGVGVLLRGFRLLPLNPLSEPDRLRSQELTELTHFSWVQGLLSGRLEFALSWGNSQTPKRWSRDLPLSDLPPWDTTPPLDWVALRLGARALIQNQPDLELPFRISGPPAPIRDDLGQAIDPDETPEVLKLFGSRLAFPLVVMSPGWLDEKDAVSGKALEGMLDQIERARRGTAPFQAPIDVRGFFFRPLFDSRAETGLLRSDLSPRETFPVLQRWASQSSFGL